MNDQCARSLISALIPNSEENKVFTYSEARQNLSELLNTAQNEEVEIRRRDGSIFSIVPKKGKKASPFDVASVKTSATTQDILDAIRESRAG